MKRLLILSFSNLKTDPRVRRQIESLKHSYDVTCAGLADPKIRDVSFIQLKTEPLSVLQKIVLSVRLKLKLFEKSYWSLPQIISAQKDLANLKSFNFILANDIIALPLALKIKKDAAVLLDAHEYAPREFEDVKVWRFFWQPFYTFLCKEYLPQIKYMTTVCDGIAKEYKKNFGIAARVIINSPRFHDLTPKPVDKNHIKIIHHGGAMPSRHIENMILMADFLDNRFQLDFMLIPSDTKYYERLKALISARPNTRLIPPVSVDSISNFCNDYDIGLFLLPPVNLNYRLALPNKFFEFAQSRLMIAIGPSPEMKKLIEQYKNGVVADNFLPRTLAEKLNNLSSAQIFEMKLNSDRMAKEQNFNIAQNHLIEVLKSATTNAPTSDIKN